MIITIDGPIATGKSTIAKKLAEKLGYIFFDTGAMYRCITYAIIVNKVNVDEPKELKSFLDTFTFEINMYKGDKRYLIGENDVTDIIRDQSVTAQVSKVSAIQAVRDKLVQLQRSLAVGVNAVFEGRDMGTIVFPSAELKIFLTGRPEVRAHRRFAELRAKFPKETESLTIEQTIEDINKRDAYDSTRKISPLVKAKDAFVVDTSDISADEIVYKILEHKDSLPTR